MLFTGDGERLDDFFNLDLDFGLDRDLRSESEDSDSEDDAE